MKLTFLIFTLSRRIFILDIQCIWDRLSHNLNTPYILKNLVKPLKIYTNLQLIKPYNLIKIISTSYLEDLCCFLHHQGVHS